MRYIILALALTFGFTGCAVHAGGGGVSAEMDVPFFVVVPEGPHGYWGGGHYHGRHYERGHYYPRHEWEHHGYRHR